MKQVTITEDNEWEGETFSYILDLDDESIKEFKKGLEDRDNVKIEIDTTFTKEQVELLNNRSSNEYMDRYQFVTFDKPDYDFDWYSDVIYKSSGFKKVK